MLLEVLRAFLLILTPNEIYRQFNESFSFESNF